MAKSRAVIIARQGGSGTNGLDTAAGWASLSPRVRPDWDVEGIAWHQVVKGEFHNEMVLIETRCSSAHGLYTKLPGPSGWEL